MLIVITALEFPEAFLKFGDFFFKLLFLLMNSFEFIESIVVDGLELLFGFLFVLFDFFLEFFVLVFEFRDFLELYFQGFELLLVEGVELGNFLVEGMDLVVFGVDLLLESGGFDLSFGVVFFSNFFE